MRFAAVVGLVLLICGASVAYIKLEINQLRRELAQVSAACMPDTLTPEEAARRGLIPEQ